MPLEPRPPVTETTGQPSWIAPAKPVVPDHELLRRIGGGSYGDVWLARTTVGTWRAVKVVFRDRFTDARPYEREFNGIQKFEPLSRGNEAFIDLLQIGRNDAEGYFYYVMELADDAVTPAFQPARSDDSQAEAKSGSPTGKSALQPDTYVPKTLGKVLLQRGRLPVSECLELGLTLNLGLAHLHRAGLIHRDIKPSNIIFVGGVPKLADIGLVIETAEARSFVGTEGFIPPEGPNSPQADLYSLGKVLYEAGMGKDRKDFPEPLTQTADAADATELLEFNAILLKACAANLKERYQSAEEMNVDMALLQSGGSVRRQRKLAGQLRFVQRAAAMVTALAAVIALGWWWQAHQTRIVRDLAAQKTKLAEEKSSIAEENRERLVRLAIANGVRLLDEGDASAAMLWFAEALPLVKHKPAEESIHRIRIQQTLNQSPRLLQLLPHESSALVGVFSPDGRRIATGTAAGRVRVWDAGSATALWPPREMGRPVLQIRFSRDGRRLFISSSPRQDCAAQGRAPANFAAVLDVESGREIFPTVSTNLSWATFSPDDRWMMLGHFDYTIGIHDARDGRLVTELRGHTGDIMMPSFSADGNLFASACRDHTARLWRLPSGEALGPPLHHSASVARAILSADGRRLVTSTERLKADEECLVQAWDPLTGEKIGGHLHVTNAAYALFFDDRGDRLFTGGKEPRVRVWNSGDHTEALRSLEMNDVASSWAFSPDGTRLALGSDDHTARVWNLETGELLLPPFRHTAWVMSVQFSPDGTRLLTTSDDGTARLWDLSFRHETAAVRLDAPIIKESADHFDAALGRQKGPFPVSLADGSVRLIDPDRLQEVHRLVPAGKELPPDRCIAAPSGRQWAVYRWSRKLLQSPQALDLWREEQGALRHFVLQHPERVQAVAFSPDETRLFTACNDGQVRAWRTDDGELQHTVKLPQEYSYVWAFSFDSRLAMLSFFEASALEVFDLTSGKTVATRFVVPGMRDRALDPQGSRIGTVSRDSYARIYDVRTGRLIVPPLKNPADVFWIDWSPDGRRIVTAGDSPAALVWDAASGEFLLSPLKTGTQPTRTARWSADARFIVTRSDDKLVRVWDAATGEPITPLLRHAEYVRFACVTANNRLVSGSDPNLLRAWHLKECPMQPDVVADYAKLLSGQRLNATGVLLPLKPDELAELNRSLRTRAPQLFK